MNGHNTLQISKPFSAYLTSNHTTYQILTTYSVVLTISHNIYQILTTYSINLSSNPSTYQILITLIELVPSIIVVCPMIDHVRWSITDFVGHPLSHGHDVIRCFCSIFNIWSLVSRVAAYETFLLKKNAGKKFMRSSFSRAFTCIPLVALAWLNILSK